MAAPNMQALARLRAARVGATSLGEHGRADREPSPAEQRRMVPQSGAYQNWSRVWNLLPAAARNREAPPLVRFGTMPGDPGGARVITREPLRGAGYMGGAYTGPRVDFGANAASYAQLPEHPHLLDLLLHESAHTAQSPALDPVRAELGAFDRFGLIEGGADAYAQARRAGARRMFGLRGPDAYRGYPAILPFAYGNRGRPGVAPHTLGNLVSERVGPQWATHDQFFAGPDKIATALRLLLGTKAMFP